MNTALSLVPARSAADFETGTLVRSRPRPRYTRIPAETGVVIGRFGEGNMLLVWFWGLGEPDAGTTVHAMFTDELTPLDTTLTTMPQGAFSALCEKAATPTSATIERELSALLDRLRFAAELRGYRPQE